MAGEANIWNPRTLIAISADTKSVEEPITATAGQTLFTLTEFVYAVGTGALEIHKNGLLLTKGTDWVEQTDTTFSLTSPATVGDIVVASGHVGITGVVDVRDTDIFVSNYQAIRDYAGTEVTVYSQGTVVAGDAGEQFFQLITGAAPGFYVDNDDFIIVPTGGDGSSAWVNTNKQKLINDLAQAYEFPTVAAYKAFTTAFPVGKVINLLDREAEFTVIAGTGTANEFNIIASSSTGQSIDLVIKGEVHVTHMGVKGDGGDDLAALQASFGLSYSLEVDLVGAPLTCRTSDTLYIGNYANSTEQTTLNLRGMIITPDDGVTVAVDSGKLVGGVWVTAWSDPIETFMSFYTVLQNFKVRGSSDLTKGGRTAVRLKDWHYQCELNHVGMQNFETGGSIKHVFGLEINQCSLFNTDPNNKTGAGFLLNDNVNLVKLHRCLSTNVAIGYHLLGGVSGVHFDNCSFEGQTDGLVCEDAVYALEVSNCYMENITATCFTFNSQVYAAGINNNYINLSTAASVNACILDYLELPNNNIHFAATNTVLWTGLAALPDNQFIKDMHLHTTSGYNRLTLERAPDTLADIDELIVDNADFPEGMVIEHIKDAAGSRPRVVNNYAIAQYSGKFTNGRDNAAGNGFEWIDDSNATLNLRTKMEASTSARIYVSIRVSGGTLGLIRGELIGDCNVTGNMDFYEYTATTMTKTNIVTVSVVSGFFHLHYTHGATITAVVGEVRLT